MLRRILNLFRPNRLDDEIREELEFHRAQTRGIFGNSTAIQEQARDASTLVWIETIFKDVRYSLRQFAKARGFVLAAVLSLALGIGANTAIFTLIDAVMLQNLPVKDPSKLVLFYDGIDTGVYSGDGFPGKWFSYASWEYFRDHNVSFEKLCAFRQGVDPFMMHVAGSPETGPKERVSGHLVSGSYFDVFGLSPAIGRLLKPADDLLNAPSVAVISYNFWNRRFHLNPSVVGTQVDLNGIPFTIVGVTPQEFFGERVQAPPDFWIPLDRQPLVLPRQDYVTDRQAYWLNLMGRLRPGVTLEGAQATATTQLRQFYLAQAGSKISADIQRKIQDAHVELKPGGGGISWARAKYSKPLHVLMAIVGLVLLIACANVATLLLARASARREELATRLALGASRGRLIRQLLTESLLLALGGAILGAALAWWGVKALALFVQLNKEIKVHPDFLVLFFTVGISVIAGIVFGLVPALCFSRWDQKGDLAARSAKFGLSGLNPMHVCLVLQVALSAVLLVGAGLLTHSLLNLEYQNFGYVRDNLLLVWTDPMLAGYQPAELPALYNELVDRLNSLPGVVSASIARYAPISGAVSSDSLSIEDYTPPAGKKMTVFDVEVAPRFFNTMGIPVLLGRAMGPRDTASTAPVAVVSETFVRQFLPRQNPIGRHLCLDGHFKAPGFEIIGVVADSKYYAANEKPEPMAFLSVLQLGGPNPYAGQLLIRTPLDPSGITAEVRKTVHDIDDRLLVGRITTLKAQIDDSLRQQKVITMLCGFFAILALLLASIGLHGTIAYSVTRRTNEIGIRMALGAQRSNILWIAMKETVVLLVIGVVVGAPLAAAFSRWIKSFLFGLPAIDGMSISAAIVTLVLVAMAASFLPARHAAQIDPMRALRHE
jgi:predicted permease